MTNEQYLYVSYFACVAGGLCLAAVTVAVLARPHRRATAANAAKRLGAVLRRVFPAWLVLAVLLGFMSVTYFDCGHSSYSSIVGDREHLIEKTQEQVSHMSLYLATGIFVYCLGFVLFLWTRARHMRSCR